MMNAIVTFAAEPIVDALDTHRLTRDIHSDGDFVYISYSPSEGKPLVANYRRISYSFVFLVALILAVPDVKPKLRLKILILGLLILFPVHILRLVVFIFNHYGQHMHSGEVSLYPLFWRKALFYAERIFRLLQLGYTLQDIR